MESDLDSSKVLILERRDFQNVRGRCAGLLLRQKDAFAIHYHGDLPLHPRQGRWAVFLIWQAAVEMKELDNVQEARLPHLHVVVWKPTRHLAWASSFWSDRERPRAACFKMEEQGTGVMPG